MTDELWHRAEPLIPRRQRLEDQQYKRKADGGSKPKDPRLVCEAALAYSLKRWTALTRFLDDGQLPIDNNRTRNQIRPIAIGRNNGLFAGSLRAGQRATAVMGLMQSAKLNGHDPYAYLKACVGMTANAQK